MKYRFLKLVLCFLCLIYYSGQAQIPDSVYTQLDSLNNLDRAQYLKDYAFKYYTQDKKLALQASQMGLNIALNEELWEKVADGFSTRGVIFGAYRDMDSSFYYLEKAMQVCNEHELDRIKLKVGMNTGVNYFYQGDYEKAIANYYTALEILEEQQDSIGIAHASGNIGLCHIRRTDFPKAIRYLKRALHIYEAKNFLGPIPTTLNGLGSAYLEVQVDSGLYYLHKGIAFLGENDRSTIKGLLNVNLANGYSYIDDFDKAFYHFDEAYDIALNLEDLAGQITALINIGRLHNDMGNEEEALVYFSKAFPMVQESKELHKEILLIEMMTSAYEKLGQLDEAYSFQKRQIELNDSLYTIEANKNIQELEAKYEFEKKEKEIALNKMQLAQSAASSQKKTLIIIVLVGSFLILSLMGFLIFKNYQSKQKRKAELAQKKLQEYARQIELLRTNIDLQLNQNSLPLAVNFEEVDLNQHLIDPLSEREIEVLHQVASGKTNKQISEEIYISVSTVKYHLSNIYLKLDVQNRTEALSKASSMNLIIS